MLQQCEAFPSSGALSLRRPRFESLRAENRGKTSRVTPVTLGRRVCVRTANLRIRGGTPRIYAGEGAPERT
jgi:hypothetical protein